MKIAEAFVEIRVDRKAAEREAKTAAQGAFDAMRDVFSVGLVIAGLKNSITDASNLNETISKTKVIFGDSQRNIEAWSQSSARALGLSKQAALDAASQFAIFGQAAGLAGGDLATFSQDLVGLSSDLASFFNTSPEQAIGAIGAALRGESEPIRAYGVLLDDATLKAKALELGLYNGVGALDQSARVLAAQKLILEQTAVAQGDFARTADGAANKQRILNAEATNASASFGQTLLPVYERALELVTFLVRGFEQLPAPLQTATVALGAFVVLSGPLGKAKDLFGDFVAAARRSPGVFRAAGVGAAFFGAALIGLEIQQRRNREQAERFATALDDLSRGTNEQAVKALGQAIVTGLAQGISTGEDLSDVLDRIVEGNLEGARRALELAKANGENQVVIDELAAAIGREEEARAQAATTTQDYGSAQTDAADATLAAAEAADAQARAAEEQKKAQDDVREAFRRNTEAVRDQLEAVRDLYNEQLSQVDAQRAYERAIDDAEAAVADFNETAADSESTLEDVEDAARTATDTIINTAKAFVESKGASLESKTGIQLMIDELYRQALALDVNSPLRANLLAYIAELQKIPTEIDTQIRLRVTGSTVTRDGDITPLRPGITNATRSARGRYVPAGANLLSTFGEEGPEAILPLDKPNRLIELLGDPRIGGPIADAMGGGTAVVTQIAPSVRVYIGDRELTDLVDVRIDQWDRATANRITRGKR